MTDHQSLAPEEGRWTMPILLIGVGGGLGAVCRHFLTVDLPLSSHPLPWPTFAVNITGCLLMGVLTVFLAESRTPHPSAQLLLGSGFLGGFTTFSHFMDGIREMVSGGSVGEAALYTILSVLGGLAAVWIGSVATQRLRSPRSPPPS